MSEVLRQLFQVIRAAGDRGCGPKAVKASFYRSDQSWAFSELNGFAVSPRLHHSRFMPYLDAESLKLAALNQETYLYKRH